MSIVRVKKTCRFTVLANDTLQDSSLSLESLGLLARLLSYPDGWNIRMGHLMQKCKIGRDKLRRLIDELQAAGYLERDKVQGPGGKWEWPCTIFESPQERLKILHGKSVDGSPVDGSPVDGEHVDILSTDLARTESKKTERETTNHQNQTGDGAGGGALSFSNVSLNQSQRQRRGEAWAALSAQDKDMLPDYLRMGMKFGGKAGGPPRNPAGWAVAAERRILAQGGLSQIDDAQFGEWVKRETRALDKEEKTDFAGEGDMPSIRSKEDRERWRRELLA